MWEIYILIVTVQVPLSGTNRLAAFICLEQIQKQAAQTISSCICRPKQRLKHFKPILFSIRSVEQGSPRFTGEPCYDSSFDVKGDLICWQQYRKIFSFIYHEIEL